MSILKSSARHPLQFLYSTLPPSWLQSLRTLKEIFLRQNRTRGSWVLGLDQGTGALRYVLWDKKSGSIVQFGCFELERQDAAGRKSSADIPTLLREIARAIPKSKLNAVHLNIQGNPLLLGRIEIPSGGKTLQPNVVRHALRAHLSIPLEDMSIIFREVGKTSPAAGDKHEAAGIKTVLSYAACHKQVTQQKVRLIQNLFGLVPDITTQGHALESLLPFLEWDGIHAGAAVAVISGGRSITSISIFKNKTLLFEREIPLAGQDITRSIFITYLQGQTLRSSEDLKVAEDLKKRSSIPLPHGTSAQESSEAEVFLPAAPPAKAFDEDENRRLFQSIHGVLAAWVQDVRLSFAYFSERYDNLSIEKIVLAGGMANHVHLAEYLGRELNMKVSRAAASGAVKSKTADSGAASDWQEHFHEYVTAYGLALKPSFQASLTPREYQTADWVEIVNAFLRIFSIVGAVLLLISFAFLQFKEAHLRDVKKVVDQHRYFLSQIEGPYREMIRWEIFFKRSDYPVPPAEEFLKFINRISPENLVLISLSYQRSAGNIQLEGLVYGDPKRRAITLAEFSKILKKDARFKYVEVPLWEAGSSGADKGRFRLMAQYKLNELQEGGAGV